MENDFRLYIYIYIEKQEKTVSHGENCVKLHQSFSTISLCTCGAVHWSFDSGDVERGANNFKRVASTLMVSIYTSCQPYLVDGV